MEHSECKRLLLREAENTFHYALANAALALGQLAEAEELFGRALKVNPNHVRATYNLAAVVDGLGRTKEAHALREKALAASREDAGAALADLGETFEIQGKPQRAIEAYRQSLNIWGADAVTRFRFGRLLKQSGAVAEAVSCMRPLADADADLSEFSASLLWQSGAILVDGGYGGDAIPLFRKSLVLEPDNLFALGGLAEASRSAGRRDLAEVVYRRILSLDRSQTDTWLRRGVNLLDMGRYHEAEGVLLEHQSLLPADPTAQLYTGYARLLGGRLTEAERSFNHVRENAPDNEWGLLHLANCLVAQGRFSEALPLYEAAVARPGASAWAHAQYAAALLALGDARAPTACRRALDADPNFVWALIVQARCFETASAPHEALALYKRAADLDPPIDWAYVNLAIALLSRGESSAAAAAAERAIALNRWLGWAHILRGHVLEASGDTQASVDAFASGLALNPSLGMATLQIGDVTRAKILLDQARAALGPGKDA